ncbi:SDR family NAD(P)-dependent oxidoreductase [Corallococcus praedator]|uniref:SDR family NAD(P)-dependent oxidoreductase n=1 Tax=Corallococcus praedator TaxID=2316724 RepID=A0ABX9QLA4_9BACT|nr:MULTISPECIES: SDR family oxidoreductase [Corallococcus]RKH16694.1 SDR family NAD(P)-dependent oxidoreductase [Corallococcus sp. CA047B]RKH30379.1 SDR family NAD(P)-dependent oxidoreductase [Corallococcus sp. CA031C]RKI09918.1 SDR family NAD(P)-dependent oxidoreductase [Corallococcus praedator]
MDRAWKKKVIVITGASSGIGRTTALLLAKKGAHVVLAARREEPLEDLAAECEALGVQALVVPTDVSDAASVHHLAEEAVRAFGHFNGWVNNAGVYMLGSLEETPDEAFRQLMEVNFFGTVSGARAALGQFRRQGYGTLVNVSSAFGTVPAPYLSAYVASKFAVRGFSASLRQELLRTGIDVCTVMPAAIDTPLWRHTANYTGWRIRPVEPVYAPERVARTILRVLRHPEPETLVGPAGKSFAAMHGLFPATFERSMRAGTDVLHFKDERQGATSGNVFQPMPEGTGTSGGYHGAGKQWLRRLLVAGGLAAAAVSLRRRASDRRLGLRLSHALGV